MQQCNKWEKNIKGKFKTNSKKGKRYVEKINNIVWAIKIDMPPNFSRNPKMGHKTKLWKKKRVGTCSLTCNISKLGGHVGTPKWDYDKLKSKSSR